MNCLLMNTLKYQRDKLRTMGMALVGTVRHTTLRRVPSTAVQYAYNTVPEIYTATYSSHRGYNSLHILYLRLL